MHMPLFSVISGNLSVSETELKKYVLKQYMYTGNQNTAYPLAWITAPKAVPANYCLWEDDILL